MGRTLLILLLGFSASFGILAFSRDRRTVESVDRMVSRYSNYSAKNTSASGAYIALNKLFVDQTWRGPYNSIFLGNDSISVSVVDTAPNRISIVAEGHNPNLKDSTQAMVFDGVFNEFAVWAKDSVVNVTTMDSLNNTNLALLMEDAPYMPEINKAGLISEATAQNNVEIGNFNPPNGYPNGSFYYFLTTPNVTHVTGDLFVQNNRTIYGIYIVEGDVNIQSDGLVRGVLYLPNAASEVHHGGSGSEFGRVNGGIVTWGTIDGDAYNIQVRHWPSYLHALVSNYVTNNPPMRVIAWK